MNFNITSGTLIMASVSAAFLVAACHSSPEANSFADTTENKATEARLIQVDTMPHLTAYDEQFYVPTADETDSD